MLVEARVPPDSRFGDLLDGDVVEVHARAWPVPDVEATNASSGRLSSGWLTRSASTAPNPPQLGGEAVPREDETVRRTSTAVGHLDRVRAGLGGDARRGR